MKLWPWLQAWKRQKAHTELQATGTQINLMELLLTFRPQCLSSRLQNLMSHTGGDPDWGSPRMGCWGRHSGLRGRKGRKLHNYELHDLYCSLSIIRVINWTYSERNSVYRVTVRKPGGKRRHGRTRCGWKIILKYILNKSAWKVCTSFIWPTIRTWACSCEYGDRNLSFPFFA